MSGNSSEPSSSSSSSVIPWGQRTRLAVRQREQQLMFQVLDNPTLREEILKHVIIGGDKKVDHRTACTLRRVDKSWNESVLRILWKVNEPLYKVAWGDVGKLTAFTKTFEMSSKFNVGPPPPLKLDGYWRLTDLETFSSVSSFLTNCGPALLQLGGITYDFGRAPPVDFPLWSLPRLRKLRILVELRRRASLAAGEQPEAEVTVEVQTTTCPIKAIFCGATALAELDLSFDEWSHGGPVDVSVFDSITFPPTLTTLQLDIELDLQQSKVFVNALLKSPLPKVTSLSFTVWKDVLADGLLFEMMDKWKTGLKNLVIVRKDYQEPPRNVSNIRFPVMEQLEEFSMSSVSIELESGLQSLERFLQKLRTLRLRFQTPGMLRKWTESSRFSRVTSLELILADGNFIPELDPDDFLVNVNMEDMQLVNFAFPNLRKLEMGISISDPSGLRYVFQEMRQLVTLKLKVFGEISEGTSHVWESILTGVPVEMIFSIRGRESGSLENVDGFVAITNLQELTSFSVEDDIAFYTREHDLGGRSLISDLIFDHAFLRMPQLQHLHFEGPFKVSQEMTERWISDEGRSLTYQPFSESDE